MNGNTYLVARVEARIPEDPDGFLGSLRTELGSAGGWDRDELPATGGSQIALNGGRNGRLAKAREAGAKAGVFLLSPLSRRGRTGRNAPNLETVPDDGAAPCKPVGH